MMQRTHRGFTLIELLVVVAIIATLASLLLPVFSQAKEKGKQATCTSNQHQLYLAITIWAQDHDERYPGTGTIWQDIEYPHQILRCPTQEALGVRKDEGGGESTSTNDYAYSSFVAEKALAAVKNPVEEILTVDGVVARAIGDGGPAGGVGIGVGNAPKATVQSVPNIFTSPADLSFRHAGVALSSYCDGHVAILREPPPFWIVEVTNPAYYKQEVLQTIYPVVLVFKEGGGIPTTMLHQKFPERAIVPVAKPVMVKMAKLCRGRVKIVMVDYTEYATIAGRYGLDGGPDPDYNYIALIFIQDRVEQGRVIQILNPEQHVAPDKSGQQMIDECLSKVQAFINASGRGE